MKFKILLLSILIYSTSRAQTKEADNQLIVSVTDDDAEMNTAIEKARQSFHVFETAFNSKKSKFSFFSIKIPFNTPDGQEHIWINDITKEKGGYFGIIEDLPQSTTVVKPGDKVKILPEKISDWMFVEDKKLRGGYTVKLIRKRMTEEERKEFDSALPFIIEE